MRSFENPIICGLYQVKCVCVCVCNGRQVSAVTELLVLWKFSSEPTTFLLHLARCTNIKVSIVSYHVIVTYRDIYQHRIASHTTAQYPTVGATSAYIAYCMLLYIQSLYLKLYFSKKYSCILHSVQHSIVLWLIVYHKLLMQHFSQRTLHDCSRTTWSTEVVRSVHSLSATNSKALSPLVLSVGFPGPVTRAPLVSGAMIMGGIQGRIQLKKKAIFHAVFICRQAVTQYVETAGQDSIKRKIELKIICVQMKGKSFKFTNQEIKGKQNWT